MSDGDGVGIKHSRTCPACNEDTFAWEACHQCGDKHWED